MSILDEMKVRRLYCDGGMGSLLQAAGLAAGELPERWNISHPEVITDVHRKYLAAGADIMTTNTFGANRLKYDKDGELKAIVEAAIANARKAVEEAGRGYVALDLGPTGKLLKPLGDLPFETAVSLYKEVVSIGAAAGADLVLIETMSDSYELKAAVLAAKEAGINPETGARLPIFATVIYDEKGKLLTGGNVESTVALLEGLGVDVLGVNCGLGPEQMKGIVKDILEVSSTPILVNPNAGLPRSENGKTVYDVDPKDFAAVMEEIVRMGAVITGGCCGTTPDHIHAMVELTKDIPVQMPEKKHRTVISSYSQAVVFDKKTIIIGERINPTGKSKFKQALRDHNLEYILREGVTQQDNGADVLDVNVGLPEIDEPSMMEDVVKELQAVIDLPLQLDTSSAEAMERGLRVYNGKPLINSVNGKKEVMEQIFPLVAKYGGVVVGLCLDEDGIPETAEGRIAVGKKIIDTAAAYGIGPEDIIFCGRQAIDGDTAQVGPQIAEKLNIPQVTYAAEIHKNGNTLTVKRLLEDGYMTVEVSTPCLITCVKELNQPRYMTVKGILECYKKPFTVLDYEALKDEPLIDPTTIGLKGSPTNIFRSFTPPQKGAGKMLQGSNEEMVKELAESLAKKHVI